MDRRISGLLTVGLLIPVLFAASGANVDKPELVCMMQDMVLTKPGVALQHDGKTYYGCCQMCKEKIASEPAKYTMGTDPVSGNKVDKAKAFIYGMEGTAYYFESEANRRAFGKSPEKYLKK